jgi:hypothetical protein
MENVKTRELSIVSRAAGVTAQTLLALKKSVDNLLSSNVTSTVAPSPATGAQEYQPITEKQKEFLTILIRKNFVDKGEVNIKLDELDGYSKADANLAIKELLGA